MVDIDGAADSGAQPITEIERLAQGIDAAPIRGIHRVARLNGNRDARRAGVVERHREPLFNDRASVGQFAGAPWQASHDHDETGSADCRGLVNGTTVVVDDRGSQCAVGGEPAAPAES